MRQIFLLIIAIPIMSLGKTVNGTIPRYNSLDKKDSIVVQKADSVVNYNTRLTSPNDKEQDDSILIVVNERDNLKKKNEELQKLLVKADKCLISVAANALYVPYEAYSIKEIAIRSFETVNDTELKKKHDIKYQLLKSYSSDIKSFLAFMNKCKNEIDRNRFIHDANEYLNSFKMESFYISYHRYDDWKGTFLGKMIDDVERQLKQFDRNTHQIHFDAMITELQNCIKTEDDL